MEIKVHITKSGENNNSEKHRNRTQKKKMEEKITEIISVFSSFLNPFSYFLSPPFISFFS